MKLYAEGVPTIEIYNLVFPELVSPKHERCMHLRRQYITNMLRRLGATMRTASERAFIAHATRIRR